MRFLGNEAEGRSVMPLNFIYDNPKDGDDTMRTPDYGGYGKKSQYCTENCGQSI